MKTQKDFFRTLAIVFFFWMLNPSEVISADYFPAGDFGSEIEAWLKKQLDFSLETLSYPEVSETKGG